MKKVATIFAPENIIENIDNIGAWSLYYLAEIAIKHFYPEEWESKIDDFESNSATVCAEINSDWRSMVIKYQKEVGYKPFDKKYVNEY